MSKTNPAYVEYVSRIASVSHPFAQTLINRGVKTSEQLHAFLNPDAGKLSDPFQLPHMKQALDRIRSAKRTGERVLVHGDYDTDGVTATAIMTEGLRELGIDVHCFIPHRITHGYGFGIAGVDRAKEIGATLIITVDCGVTSFEAASAAKHHGIDVVVTDHHEPMRSGKGRQARDKKANNPVFLLPEAIAVVNPRTMEDNSSLSHLSGAGVALNVVRALFGGSVDNIVHLLDLAALGSAADVVPLLADNRVIVKEGIKLIESGERTGIRALREVSGVRPGSFRTSSLYFGLIPRLNAAGRMADATDVVRLLTTKSAAEAEELAVWLNDLNGKRQKIEESVYQEAMKLVDSTDISGCGAIVLASEGWHPGVVGIVASRIAEEYYRPAFVLAIENGTAKGSARSIPPFDIHYGLTQCSEVLERFGGHAQAAGLALSVGMLEEFRTMISEVVLATMSGEDLVPTLCLDAAVRISEVNLGLVGEIARLEPFGCGNEEPLFGAKGLVPHAPRVVGSKHLKMLLRQNGFSLDTIGFDLGGLLDTVDNAGLIDAAFLPMINEWNGDRHVQLNLKALRPSESH